jgi:hypothetical protein
MVFPGYGGRPPLCQRTPDDASHDRPAASRQGGAGAGAQVCWRPSAKPCTGRFRGETGMNGKPAALLGLCLLVVACSGGTQGRATGPSTAGPALQEIQSRSAGCGRSGSPCAEVLIRWPALPESDDPAITRARAWLAGQLARDALTDEDAGSPETASRRFLTAFDRELAASPGLAQDWFLQRRAQLLHEDDRVISLVVEESLYTGGAHPLSSRRLASFKRADGERLTLEGVLRPEASELFGDLLVRALRRARELPPGTALADAGFFLEDGRLPPTDNFAVTAEGWLLHYDPYEIAPYAMGPTELRLGFREIENLVLPGSAAAPRSPPLIANPD